MIMGRLIVGKTYSMTEILEALLIATGVAVFSTSSTNYDDNNETSLNDQAIGFSLLVAYVLTDAFTSQWQSKIYRAYNNIDHYQMMYGVNMSATVFTLIALITSNDIPLVLEFLQYNTSAIWYLVLTAISNTTGQIAILYTIKKFGPVVMAIMMTTRQMMSIVLSTIIFGHSISFVSIIGASFVFIAIAHSIYRQSSSRKKEKDPSTTSQTSSYSSISSVLASILSSQPTKVTRSQSHSQASVAFASLATQRRGRSLSFSTGGGGGEQDDTESGFTIISTDSPLKFDYNDDENDNQQYLISVRK